MATEVASLFGTLRLDDKQFNAGLATARGNLSAFSGRVQSAGQAAMAMGGRLTLGVTTPILGAGIAAVKAGIDMESAFTGVIKTVDATAEQLDTLRGQLVGMATDAESPLSALDNAHIALFEIAETAGQLGVSVDDIDEFTQAVGMLAMTTDIQGQEGAMALAQFTNITGFPTSEIMRLGDVIADLGNNSATTESQILAMGQRIAPLSTLGLTEDELLAFSAAMASVGISAELGGTNFTKGVNEIMLSAQAGGAELDIIADIAGMTADSFAALMTSNPDEAITAFVEGLGQLDRVDQVVALDSINIKGQEAQRVFTSLAANTSVLTSALDVASNAFAGNGALMTEAQTRAATTAGSINLLKNNLNQLASVFADVLLPPLNQFLPILTGAITRVSEMNPHMIQMTVVALAAAAAVGPIVTVIGGLTTAIGILLAPAGLLAVAIGAIIYAAHRLYPGGIVALFTDASTSAQMLGQIGMVVLRNAVEATGNAIDVFRQKVRDAKREVENLQNRIGSGAGGIGNILSVSGQKGFGSAFLNAVGFADGGRPAMGVPSIVGERGPELFVPDSAGTVVPNEAMGGTTINISIGRVVSGNEAEAEALAADLARKLQKAGVRL